MNKEFNKQCPKCDITLTYSRKDSLKESIDKGRLCKSCSKKGKQPAFYVDGKIPEDILVKISKNWFIKGHRPVNADQRKGKTIEEIYGTEKSKEIREKYSKWERTRESNIKRTKTLIKQWENGAFDNVNREVSEETRRKHRLNMFKRLKATGKNFHPGYNRDACYYFNELMKETNTNIQHALNGGEFQIEELGFWVDGYDLKNNIVYEFDEKRHFNKKNKLKKKDVHRQKLITEHLNCKFIRIRWDTI